MQLKDAMWDVKNVQVQINAKKELKETLRRLLLNAKVPDRKEALTTKILWDSQHPVTTTLLWCYSGDFFLFGTLNAASRKKDQSKIKNLGPFACAFMCIIGAASQYRKDIDPSLFVKIELFRGSALTEKKIEEFR